MRTVHTIWAAMGNINLVDQVRFILGYTTESGICSKMIRKANVIVIPFNLRKNF